MQENMEIGVQRPERPVHPPNSTIHEFYNCE